jgi:hypothetical protein
MKMILHILTRPEDALAQMIIQRQQKAGGTMVDVVDLTQPNPDYDALLEKIFVADSLEVW